MNCFNRTQWNYTEEKVNFSEWEHFNNTIQEMINIGLKVPVYKARF